MKEVARQRIDVGATLACLGSLFCWSVGPIFIKLLSGFVDLWMQNLLRYLVACLFWLPFLLYQRSRENFNHKVWSRSVLPAAANIFLQSFWAASFYYIGPALMSLLVKSSVIWIAGFSLIFFPAERGLVRSKRFWSALVLSMVGVMGVILSGEAFTSEATVKGIILTMSAAFGWAVYSILAKISFRDIDVRLGFSVTSIYTVVGLGVLAIVFGKPGMSFEMTTVGWVYVVVSGIVSIAVSHVLYYAAMKRIGATIPSLVLLGTPFLVFSISRVVFGETLSLLQGVFGAILLLGCGISIWAQGDLAVNR